MSNQKTSRRNFLKIAGITVGATALTCSGAGYVVTRKPSIPTPEVTYQGEENTMNERILITYATRAGSTAEIAAAIGESLSERGFTVDVKSTKDKPTLDGYQAVLVGSAIRMGKWLPESISFVEENQAALKQMPVALFTVHLNNLGDDEESRVARQTYLDAVRSMLPDAEAVYFAGAMDYSRLSFLDRLIAKAVGSTETDERDWDRICGWMPEAVG